MKKKLFFGLLAAAAVTFTACQKDEVLNQLPQDNEIGFSTYVGRGAQTKASVTDINAMKVSTYSGIGVFAYHTSGDFSTPTIAPNFMVNQLIKWDPTANSNSGKWNYNPTQYWPKTGKVSFFAYAPYNSTNPFSGNTGNPIISYTIQTDVSSQIDILSAAVKDQNSGTVNFVFNHALAKVGFTAVTSSTDENTSITINEVELLTDGTDKFYSSGTLDLTDGTWTSKTEGSDTYTLSGNKLKNTTVGTSAAALNADDAFIMLIPENNHNVADANLAPMNVNIRVNYSVTTEGGTTVENNITTAEPIAVKFQQGKAYTFAITIGLNAIVFDATVNPWTEVSASTVTF